MYLSTGASALDICTINNERFVGYLSNINIYMRAMINAHDKPR